MERSAHAWGAAQPQHICALRAAAQRTALRTKWELQTAHAVPAVCSALYAARAAPHACCAPYLRSYMSCVLRCMYATRHNVCCMPLQVRSAALRRIYMHNLKNRRDICTTPTRNDRVYFVQTPCRKLDVKNRRAHFAAERSDFSVYFGRVSHTY